MASFNIGIQLYTVRDALKKDFQGTIQALADMGYEGVEFAWNYGGMNPDALADFLDTCGLQAAGLHAPLDDLLKPDGQSYAYALGIGSPYVTTSLAGEVAKDWQAAVKNVAKAGKIAADHGLCFTYHNHAQEFETVDGEVALDMLYEKTDPEAVQGELDTYWIKKGGQDPVAYIRKYAWRVPQIHLKDMDKADGSFAPVGTGLIDVPAVLALAEEIGAAWVIVEQDTCKGPALEAARTSIGNIRKAI